MLLDSMGNLTIESEREEHRTMRTALERWDDQTGVIRNENATLLTSQK
jgi:hypothetical protein